MTATVVITASERDVAVVGSNPGGNEQVFSNVVKKGTTETFFVHPGISIGVSEIAGGGKPVKADDNAN